MAIAAQSESPYLVPIATVGHIQSNPTHVTHVGRNVETRVGRHQALCGDPDPEVQLKSRRATLGSACLAGSTLLVRLQPLGAKPRKGLLACPPDWMPELNTLGDFRP